MSKKDDLVFATLTTGEIVLGKVERIKKWSANSPDELDWLTAPEPLRYGNEKAAKEKVGKVKNQLAAQGTSSVTHLTKREKQSKLASRTNQFSGAERSTLEDRELSDNDQDPELKYLWDDAGRSTARLFQPTGEIKTPAKVEVETEAGFVPIGEYLMGSPIYHPSITELIGKRVIVTKTGPPTIEMVKAWDKATPDGDRTSAVTMVDGKLNEVKKDDLAPFKKMAGFVNQIGTSAKVTKKQLEAMYRRYREFEVQLNKLRFATTSGERYNPRNRHNHGHKGQSDEKYYYFD